MSSANSREENREMIADFIFGMTHYFLEDE